MAKIYDDVLGREETIQSAVTPQNEKEIEHKEIEPQISFEEALKELRGE